MSSRGSTCVRARVIGRRRGLPEDEAPVVAALGSWIGQQTLARSLSPGGKLDLAIAGPGSAAGER